MTAAVVHNLGTKCPSCLTLNTVQCRGCGGEHGFVISACADCIRHGGPKLQVPMPKQDVEQEEVWGWRDRRTGKDVSLYGAPSELSARRRLGYWMDRDREGGRPELHGIWPHVEVYRRYPPEVRHD